MFFNGDIVWRQRETLRAELVCKIAYLLMFPYARRRTCRACHAMGLIGPWGPLAYRVRSSKNLDQNLNRNFNRNSIGSSKLKSRFDRSGSSISALHFSGFDVNHSIVNCLLQALLSCLLCDFDDWTITRGRYHRTSFTTHDETFHFDT
jgi:hypothetical protein